ncbi:MAG: type III secretion protein [Desulfovibrio sp.]|nr:type III secretion protein [Desulfovibrio sp.]
MAGVSINLLDPNLGIQNVMESGGNGAMPNARPLASTVLREAGLDELYNAGTAARQLEAALCPPVGDGSLLQPENFLAELKGSLNALRDSREPAVRAFVRDELNPLLENTELLKAYTSLMIGG